ncbi:MAG: YbaB/EbfC family nucleoid-associated protein [Lachnospiraceae bacterium]|nr:YbaB/EbfC family nucleoid-associated protein [Lachnospiraceae bacterium]
MAKGGFPGGMGGMNMNNLMKQAQKMQQQMADTQKELETKTYTASAGGGMVTAVVNGKKQLSEVRIDPEAVDPDDVEMLQDMVVAAVNQALSDCEKDQQSAYGRVTGGLGGFGF